MKQKILFIHRSVGKNLINDGELYKKIKSIPNIDFNDYNVNTKILRSKNASQKFMLDFPNNNTTPKDYSILFHKNTNYQNTKDYILSYNTVIIKSCYPNSNIKNNQNTIPTTPSTKIDMRWTSAAAWTATSRWSPPRTPARPACGPSSPRPCAT